ncbi:MAG: hypothetical protein ACYC7L_05945 [Nitrospirota bacterium]
MDDLQESDTALPGRVPGLTGSGAINVYCRLFSDVVPMGICILRKKELNTFGWQSCSGCAIGLLQYSLGSCEEPAP